MKVTDQFTEIIKEHLQELAEKDELFAETLKKPEKNINDCTTYILNQVKASGRQGFADEEIFGMAVHYYDEDDVTVGSPIKANIVVNRSVPKAQTIAEPSLDKPKTLKKSKKIVVPETQTSLF